MFPLTAGIDPHGEVSNCLMIFQWKRRRNIFHHCLLTDMIGEFAILLQLHQMLNIIKNEKERTSI